MITWTRGKARRDTPDDPKESLMTAPTFATAAVRIATAQYDAAVDGGLAGTRRLRGDLVPAGAIVTDLVLRIDEPFTFITPNGPTSRGRRAAEFPAGTIHLGDTSPLTGPILLVNSRTLHAGRVLRGRLVEINRVVASAVEQPMQLGIHAPQHGDGFATGRFTVAATYLELPTSL